MSIDIADLAFGYPGHPVGSDVSLGVAPGEVLCLLGPNGCGKTTLFKTILGLLPPLNGRIVLDGETTDRWSRRRTAQQLAYVPQQHDAYFPFTVMEVVLMGRGAHVAAFATPGRHDREVAKRTLRQLHLLHLRDQVYSRISSGERQLTLIARALTQQARVLIMDEPTANLDFGNQILVLNQIRRLKQAGITIMMSTHDPGQAFYCADKVAMLRGGRLLCWGPTDEVLTSANLRSVYGVDVAVVEVAETGEHPGKVCVPVISDPRGHADSGIQAPWA